MPEPLCKVDLACNDPNTGHFTGWAPMIDFECDGDEVGLVHPDLMAAADGIGVAVVFDASSVRIGGERYPHHGFRDHVGNWCWSQVDLTLSDALRLLKQLLEAGFRAESGTCGGVFDDLVQAHEKAQREARRA